MSPNSRVVPLRCSSSRARVSVNPACIASAAEMKGDGGAADKHSSAARKHQGYRSREEEKPSPMARRRRRDEQEDRERDASPPERKRGRRGSVPYHRHDFTRGSSSSITRHSSSGADARRRGRDDRAAKRKQAERDRARKENHSRRSVVSSPRAEQRARPDRASAAQAQHQQHQPAAVARHDGAAVVDDGKGPTPEEEEAAEAARKLDIQRQREEARRELDRMVKTVEFNDPFISPMDVLKPATGVWTKEWRNRGK